MKILLKCVTRHKKKEAEELLLELEARGITVKIENGEVSVTHPSGRLSEGDLERLRDTKASLLLLHAAKEHEKIFPWGEGPCDAFLGLRRRGVKMWHQGGQLKIEYPDAAAEAKLAGFVAANKAKIEAALADPVIRWARQRLRRHEENDRRDAWLMVESSRRAGRSLAEALAEMDGVMEEYAVEVKAKAQAAGPSPG